MSFPVHDWQFWVVTGLFLAAAGWMGRGLVRRSKRRRTKRATLTVGGKPLD